MKPHSIPLASLDNVELRSTKLDGRSVPCLWFACPVCDNGHRHAVHFLPPPAPDKLQGVLIWRQDAGQDLSDLTLSPSYLARHKTPGAECRLHVFVRRGQLQVLGDSGVTPKP